MVFGKYSFILGFLDNGGGLDWGEVKNIAGSNILFSHTALRNHMRIVFEEMSSWTPLTMYLGIKTHFRPNIYEANMSGFFLW